jgi:23S rRNA (guanosine2251-2'-O)-methyltransferase
MPKIIGINAVLEALRAKEPIDKIYILSTKNDPVVGKIFGQAKNQNIPVVKADRIKMAKLSDGKKHQGVIALIPPISYVPLEILVEKVQKSGEHPVYIILDRITDPQNFGAIIRSAEVLGIHGIIFSIRESVPVTDQVIKASAGAIFHLDICKVTNIAGALDYLKKCGIWVYASSSHTSKQLWDMDFTGPSAIIIGSEGKGVRPLLIKNSDDIFSIPQKGKTESLNASVAAGIIMSEVLKQRANPLQ